MEYACNGDLNKIVCLKRKTKEFFSEEQVLKWMIQLFLAVFYLHEKDVVHCDLKLENIFLTYFNDVKIGDFGIGLPLKIKKTQISLAKILRNPMDSVKTCFGTPYYIAPELCEVFLIIFIVKFYSYIIKRNKNFPRNRIYGAWVAYFIIC